MLAAQVAQAQAVVAHRGDQPNAPENTLSSAKRCAEMGVDYLDCDVQMSKDGVFYLMHDFTVMRTTDGKGFLGAMTSEEIDKLDAGIKFGEEFRGERVPRVSDVMAWAKGKIKLYFDLKRVDIPSFVALVREHGFEQDCFFWSYNPTVALELRKAAPDFALKINASTPEAVEEAVAKFQCTMIECGIDALTPELREACRKHNLKIMIKAGPQTDEEYQRIIDAGVDFANVDDPKRFLAMRDAKPAN